MLKTIQIFHWLPRILCIAAILFVGLFALDSFDPRLTIWQQIGGFLLHLIPCYILITFLILAWKYELIGGVVFVILGIGLSPYIYTMNYHMNHSVLISLSVIGMITLPFVVVGGLFILSHFLKKRKQA